MERTEPLAETNFPTPSPDNCETSTCAGESDCDRKNNAPIPANARNNEARKSLFSSKANAVRGSCNQPTQKRRVVEKHNGVTPACSKSALGAITAFTYPANADFEQ